MINFPSSLDNFSNPTSSDLLDNATSGLDHWTQHGNVNDAIEALEAKVGVDSSAVTTSHDYKLSGVTGSDKAVSKTGAETLTNKTLTAPVINVGSDATGDTYYRNSGGTLTRLPIGSTDQVLTVAGGLPSWASNPSAADASYAAKGIVRFDTDAATSGITVASGVATLNTGTTANKIVKLDASAKLPAVDGSQLTGINSFKNGVTTHDNSGTTSNVIAHGLSATPKRVRIVAIGGDTVNLSSGTYNGTTMSCIYKNTGTNKGSSTAYIINTSGAGSQTVYSTATIAVDSTNITLTWTKTGADTGTTDLMWEAEL